MPTGKGILRIAIEDFLETFGFGGRIALWIKGILETWEEEAIASYEDLINVTGIAEHIPQQIKPATLRAMTKHQIALIAVLIPLLFSIIQKFSDLFITPFLRPLNFIAEGLAHTKHGDPQTLLQALRRRPDLEGKLRSLIATGGFDEITIAGFESLIDQYLPPTEYQRLRLRKELSDSEFTDKLKKLGYKDDDIADLMKLSEVIPSINDLILMAVREAFDDGVSARFQHDENFPAAMAEWAAKQGLNAEWSKRYWRSHWQLPSPTQVFEMLHRLRPGKSNNPVTHDDVNTFLRTADYAPFWRERLSEISHAPFTRVDVRRMYKTRTLTEAQVKDAYLDLGYDNEKADALTRFTIAYEAEEETGIVRSSVTSAYNSGFIDRATAEKMLSDGGYDTTTIAFYLNNVDFQHSLDVQNIKLQNIHKKFVEGIIDETSVNNEINQLNLPSERSDALLELWITERENQIQLPTLAQIENFYELGIATLEDFKHILILRGYTQQTIDWNIQRIDIEKAIKAKNDAEKAQADSERLNKSSAASQYQKDKAEIDLAIAQAKAEITDIDIALHGIITAEESSTLANRKDELKLFISQMNVQKAQLRFDLTSGQTKG